MCLEREHRPKFMIFEIKKTGQGLCLKNVAKLPTTVVIVFEVWGVKIIQSVIRV